MQKPLTVTTGECKEASEADRQADSFYSSSIAGAITLQAPANDGFERFASVSELRYNGKCESRMQGGSSVVDSESRSMQRQIDTQPSSRIPHHDRCVECRMGSLDNGLENSRPMGRFRGEVAYKCKGTEGRNHGSQGLCEATEGCAHRATYGQCVSSGTSQQESEPHFTDTDSNLHGTLGVLHGERHCCVSSLFAGQQEPNSRRAIKRSRQGLQQLETGSEYFSPSRDEVRRSTSGLVRGPIEYPEENILQLETGPIRDRHGCSADRMEEHQGICISPVLPSRKSVKKGKKRGSITNIDHAYVAKPVVVPITARDDSCLPDPPAAMSITLDRSKRRASSADRKERDVNGGVESVRGRARMQGFSEDASRLLSNRWRPGTQTTYEYAWRKWSSWAREREIYPFSASVVEVCNFLSDMHTKGFGFSTINGFRSAISQIHPTVDQQPIGQHPDVVSVMAGVFNENPPRPKYTAFWDVSKVLDFLKAWGENENLGPKDLSWKLAVLMALATASRTSDLSLLSTASMVVGEDKVVFHIEGLTKT